MQKKVILNPLYKECETFANHVEDNFNTSTNTIHKARNEIKVLPCKQYNVVIKAYKIPNIINAFGYTYLRDSKAKKAYNNALRLHKLNINTPSPIALIEEYSPLLGKSFFISEEIPYDFTLREPLNNINFPERDHIFEAFAKFTVTLHKNGVLHKDYSPGNILLKKADNDFIFSIVDINRMSFQTIDYKVGCKNLSHLWTDQQALTIIGRTYAKEMGYDENNTTAYIIELDRKHKKFKKNKYKIKNLFVSKEKRRYQ